MSDQNIHSGFISVMGRPNVGKSSLSNRLLRANRIEAHDLRLGLERLGRGLRRNDLVARVGGDEFCVVIVGPEADRAVEVAEQALELFREADDTRSFSSGVAIATPNMTHVDVLADVLGTEHHVLRLR